MSMFVRYLIFFSPLILVGVGLLLFLLRSNRKQELLSFIGGLILASVIGFVVVAVAILYLTLTFDSPQAPFTLIFYGPIGMAAGEIVFIAYWMLRGNRDQEQME